MAPPTRSTGRSSPSLLPSTDPGGFVVPHPSDTQAYKNLGSEQRTGEPGRTAFPVFARRHGMSRD